MTKASLLAVLLLLAAASHAWAQAVPEPEAGGVTPPRLSYVDGPVSFWRPAGEGWAPAQLNIAIAPGDALHTGHRGNVELQIGARAFVRAWGDTQLQVTDQTAGQLRLNVTEGHVAVDARALDPDQIIQIEAPGATFAIDRPGYYRVDVAPDRALFITRRDGHATMTHVEAGTTHTSAAPEPDVWDRWNLARTDALVQAASARYVPEGVYGIRDLDDHGDWRVVQTYGAVWVPRGAPAGWAPYTMGRWVWDPRFGWTWVDTAVWGWAPFHHGRWVFLDGIWAWAPGPIVRRPVYAPALVAFFSAPGVRISIGTPFVSWVALGWGEPVVPWWGRPGFIGRPAWHGWGGPRIVNNVVVQKTVVHADEIHVYRNATVHRAVVAVPPERFGRARVQDARVTEIDTRRLQPVRGPLRAVPEPVRRVEPGAPTQPPTSARRAPEQTPRPPQVTREPTGPSERRSERRAAPPPSEPPRGEPSRPEPRSRLAPRSEPSPRVEPSRPDPRSRVVPRSEPSPRVEPSRPEPRPRVEPPRSGPSPRIEPSRPEPRSRVEPPRSEPVPRAEPSRPEPQPRIEMPRPQASPRLDSPRPDAQPRVQPLRPDLRPRVEPSRPEMRSGPSPRAADRVVPGRGQQVEPRRAPAAPALKGAASGERQGRGGARDRAR